MPLSAEGLRHHRPSNPVVGKIHNRPLVSIDNPFSESEFRTMKYRPSYPGTFETLDEARSHMDASVAWSRYAGDPLSGRPATGAWTT
jgi:hypothetical protein